MSDRLERQIEFILEIDKLKSVCRRSYVTGQPRQENSAEHSWHIALMAFLLAEYANEPVDVHRVIKMLLVHDLVEIDAGDTYCYDPQANLDKAEREQKAADRLFNLLPEDQARELFDLWNEFEAMATPESKYANALDRMQAILLNYHGRGRAWLQHQITQGQVRTRNAPIGDGARELWTYVSALIDRAVEKGFVLP